MRNLFPVQYLAKTLSRVLLSTLCILPVLPMPGCGSKSTVAADQPVPVKLRVPRHVEQPVSVAVAGSVEANLSAMAAFQIPGRVVRVFVEEGQPVVKGQVLAELDSTDYRNALDAASAQADAAKATDQKAQAGLRPQEMEQARIDDGRAEDEYKRMKFLYERSSISANDFHKVEAVYKAAHQRYEMALQGTRGEEKLAAGAQFRAAGAQMHEAQKRMADCRLVAPFSGFVGVRRVEVGDTVAAGTPVFSVLDLNPVKVRVGIPESEMGKIHEGARALVTIPFLENHPFEGKVTTLGVVSDSASRTYTAKISVPNADHLLRAGMISQARLYGSGAVNALTVPGSAIVRDPRGLTLVYVYNRDRQRVYARRVDTGAFLDNEVEIKSGLDAGDQIVIEGQQNVREGSLVRVAGAAQ